MNKLVYEAKSSKLKKWMSKHYMPKNCTFIFRDTKNKVEWAEEHCNLLMSPKFKYK